MQAQQKSVNDVASKNNQSRAHKRATTLFAAETKKLEDERKLSASKVSELVYGEFGVNIHKRTIRHEASARRLDVCLSNLGMKGNIN